MITSPIHLALILAFVGAIVWLLLFTIEELAIPVRYRRASRVAVLAIGVLVVILVLFGYLLRRIVVGISRDEPRANLQILGI